MTENGASCNEGIGPDSHHRVTSPVELDVGGLFIFVDEKGLPFRKIEDGRKTHQTLFNILG